jgi:YD repeat-containing protein
MVGVLVATDFDGFQYHETDDGGETWGSVITIGAALTFATGPLGFAIYGDHRFAVGVDGSGNHSLYHSTNGTSWSKFSGAPDSNTPLPQIDVVDDSVLYFTDPEGGALYRVDDYAGSPSYTDITPSGGYIPHRPYAFSVDPSNSNNIILIGEASGTRKLFTSSDGGDNWTDHGATDYSSASLASPNLMLLGDNLVEYSPDNGETILNRTGDLDTTLESLETTLEIYGFVGLFSLFAQDPPPHDNFQGSNIAHVVTEPSTANQIGLRTGEKRERVTDLIVHTPAGPLSFTRSFRQTKLDDSNYQFMGMGWTHDHKIRLVEDTGVSPNAIVLRGAGASEIQFEKTDTDHYEALAGSSAVIDVDTGSTSARYTLTTTDETQLIFEVYDTNKGRIVQRVFPNGMVWTYSYDGNGSLSEVVDDGFDLGGGVKRKLILTYYPSGDHAGQLYRVTDHAGRFVEFAYIVDHDGGSLSLLDTVTDILGEDWTYEYEDTIAGQLNYLIKTVSPSVDSDGDGSANGAITLQELSYTLDGGQVTDINEQLGDALIETDYAILPDGGSLSLEERAGQTTKHAFAGGVYTGAQDANGNAGQVVTNAAYLPVTQINPNGAAETLQWSEDATNLEKATDALGNDTQFVYNDNHTLQQRTDAEGRKTTYSYDAPLRQPAQILVSDGDAEELDINGGMEVDSGWSDVGSPTTNEQSASEVDTGDYARHIDGDSGEGVESASWTMEADKTYVIRARVYAVSGTVKLKVSGMAEFDQTTSVTGSWETLRAVHTPGSGGSKTLQFLADGGSAEFYVDSVHLVEVEGLLEWQDFVYDDQQRPLEEATINPENGVLQQKITRTYYTSGEGAGFLESATQHDVDTPANNLSTTYTYDDLGRVIKTQKSSLFGTCAFTYTVYSDAGQVVATVCGRQNVTPPTSVAEAQAMYDANDPVEKYNRVTIYDYDTLGRRFKVTTNAGASFEKVTLTAYDSMGRVVRVIANYVANVSITAPFTAPRANFDHGTQLTENLVTDIVYNEAGLVRKQTDPEGRVTLYGYDNGGRLVKTIANAATPSYNNAYLTGDPDLSSYTASSAADEDIVTEQGYDAAGNVVRSVDAMGVVNFGVYDALNRVVKRVRAAKDSATVALNKGDASYDAANDPRSDNYEPSDDPDRDLIDTIEYDAMGRVIRTRTLLETRPAAIWTTTLMGYNADGKLVKSIRNAYDDDYDLSADPDLSDYSASSAADEDIVTSAVYDDQKRTLYVEDVNNNRRWMGYDGLGRRVKTIANAVGTATDGGSGDPRSSSYTPSADADQDLIVETDYDVDGRVQRVKDVLGRYTLYGYDELGRLVKTVANADDEDYFTTADPADPDLSDYSPVTDSDTDIVSETVYDDEGRVIQTIDARGNVTHVVYDDLGRRLLVVTHYVEQGASDPADWEWVTSQWEDGSSNAIDRGSDNDQNVIQSFEYNLGGRVVKTRDAGGVETRYSYDDLGRRTQTVVNYVDGAFNAASPDEDLIALTAYDKVSRVIQTTDPRGTATAVDYDAVGRQRQVTQADGTPLAATTYACFDKGGRLLRVIQNWSDDPNEASPDAQDANGDWLFVPDDNGAHADRDLISSYAYDGLGRRTQIADPLGNITQSVYFKDGQLNTLTDPANGVAAYRYDAARRPETIVQGFVAAGTDPDEWVWSVANARWEEN